MRKDSENRGRDDLPEIQKIENPAIQPEIISARVYQETKLEPVESTRPDGRFDLNKVYSWWNTLLARIFLPLTPYIFAFLRNIRPVFRLGRTYIVTRYDDVQEVLEHDTEFEIPFEHKGRKLGWSPNFLLGMQDGKDYQRTKEDVFRIFRRSDIKEKVASRSREIADEILDNENGRIDVVSDLIARVPTRIAEEYYGVKPIEDRREFEDCLVALSGYFFGGAGKVNDKLPKYAEDAFGIVRHTIQTAVNERIKTPGDLDTDILGRMLHESNVDPEWFDNKRIVSYLFGMILGFLPTNLMANSNLLEVLFMKKEAMAITTRAARDNDDALLSRCLFEALRFRPINPGPWRWCMNDYMLSASTGRWDRYVRNRLIKEGRVVLAGTQSGMHDGRRIPRSRDFNPDRSDDHYMNFGHGLHWCVGKYIAEAQITQTMKALLLRPNLRPAPGRAGKMKRISFFPRTMFLEYD